DTNIENEFLAFFDDVGGPEMAPSPPSPITHHDIESDSTIESDSNFEEHLKEDYEETDITNYEIDDDKIIATTEILAENKKKYFHNICSVAFLNPITLEIEDCNKPSTRRLWNLIGNWKINSNCVVKVNRNIERLG
ncbi:17072_t:CDS:2, partial [Funneliformis geosporum]